MHNMRTAIILLLGTLAFILTIADSDDFKTYITTKAIALIMAALTYALAKNHKFEHDMY